MKISNGDINHEYSYIEIIIKNNVYNKISNVPEKKLLLEQIENIQCFLISRIGSDTTIEYHVEYPHNNTIKLPIKIYTEQQRRKTIKDLVDEKFKTITNLCKSFDDSLFRVRTRWFFRCVNKSLKNINKKYDINNIFEMRGIVNGKEIKKVDLFVKYPKLIDPVYKIETLKDGSRITQFIDPYMQNYLLAVDYSKPMSELNYGYNYLHLYEHYMTYAWHNIREDDLIFMNGGTYSHGLCYVYNVSKDINDIKTRTEESIKFHIRSSDPEFIKKTKALDTETIRTISETYANRNLTRSGRSDQSAFNEGYNINVLAYWSSLPLNILVITNEEIKLDINELNKYYDKYHMNQKKPKTRIYNYYPKEVLFNHYLYQGHVYKKDTKEILKDIYAGRPHKGFYGIDSECVQYANESEFLQNMKEKNKNNYNTELIETDISTYQDLLAPLLYFAKFVKKEVVDKYINENVFPFNAIDFDKLSIISQYKNIMSKYSNIDL